MSVKNIKYLDNFDVINLRGTTERSLLTDAWVVASSRQSPVAYTAGADLGISEVLQITTKTLI